MLKIEKEKLNWLFHEAKRIVISARLVSPAYDGTFLYCPDAIGNYKGIWSRDFAYIVDNVPELLTPKEVKTCYYYLIRHQRLDGAMPASVGVNIPDKKDKGEWIGYTTVGNGDFSDLDNSQFVVKIVYDYYRYTGDIELFVSTLDRLKRAMDFVPRSSLGLVWIDPDNPHTGYGFTDSVIKTGNELFCSLLYWEASLLMAEIYGVINKKSLQSEFLERAKMIEKNIDVLWDEKTGAFYTTTIGERRIDIWGNAFAVYINFPLGNKEKKIIDFLIKNYNEYIYCGQIRHLLKGEYWTKTCYEIPGETYQNGAYWGTASGWIFYAIAKESPGLASEIINEMIDYYRNYGVYECVNENYNKVKDYVASITNPVGAIKRLIKEKILCEK